MKIKILIITGLLIRYIIGAFTSWTWDDEVWYRSALDMVYGLGLYGRMNFPYPPVWGYILGFFVKSASLFFDPGKWGSYIVSLEYLKSATGMVSPTVTSPLFNVIFKTPLFLADIAVGLILYRFVLDITGEKEKGEQAFILWYFNPLVFVVSSVHGAFDVLPTLFMLLSLILVYKKNCALAGSMWVVGILTKLFPIYFLPVFIAFILISDPDGKLPSDLLRSRDVFWRLIYFAFGGAIAIGIILLPLIFSGNLDNLFNILFRRFESGMVFGGLSPWFIEYIPRYGWLLQWTFDNTSLLFSTLNKVYIIISIFIFLGMLFCFKDNLKTLIYGSLGMFMTIYLVSPIVQPQYLIWSLPVIILSIILFSDGKYIYPMLTFAGLLYYYSLIGINIFYFPFLLYNNTDFSHAIQATGEFLNQGGILNTYIHTDYQLLSGIIAFAAMISTFVSSLSNLFTKGDE